MISKGSAGLLLMQLLRERDADSWGNHENPNHGVAYRWNPYGKDEQDFYECVVLNSESPCDQVWLGNGHKWYRFYGGKEFRRMAAWVLWRWIWHDWCGLKTKLWLVGLDWRCEGSRQRIAKMSKEKP